MKKSFFVSILLSSLFFCSSLAFAETPKEVITSTVDQLVKIVEQNPGAVNLTKRRDLMFDVINPRFDFAEMSKSALGRFWLECTPQEQSEFVKVFSDLLAKTYLDRIDSIEKDVVKVNSERVNKNRGLVKTTVNYKGDIFPIDYRMVEKDGQWKVYDVVIENIGLVNNYRNEFSGIIRKEKFSGLMVRLREKLAKASGK